jgi:hypothetical protein
MGFLSMVHGKKHKGEIKRPLTELGANRIGKVSYGRFGVAFT